MKKEHEHRDKDELNTSSTMSQVLHSELAPMNPLNLQSILTCVSFSIWPLCVR